MTTSLGALAAAFDDVEAKDKEIERLKAKNQTLETALVDVSASLVAAVDLLDKGGRKAAPSNKMFEVMLDDYRKSVARARAVLTTKKEKD